MIRNTCFIWALVAAPAVAVTPAPPPARCHDAGGLPAAGLPAPPLNDTFGPSHLPVTTRSEVARRYVAQGVSLLHCFWEFEAVRAFRAALAADPACTMAHWGLHVALLASGESEQAEAPLARAVTLSEAGPEHERLYVQAWQARAAEGDAAFVRGLETLVERHPEDPEAAAFLALQLMHGYDADSRPKDGQLYSQFILSDLVRRFPGFAGAHHYTVHALEMGTRPESALESARRLVAIAPGCPHYLHMPGHVFFRLGRHAEAQAAFEASLRADEAYLKAQRVPASSDWNYLHNFEYLATNEAEVGRYRAALGWARRLASTPPAGRDAVSRVLHVATAELRVHLRFGRWREAHSSLPKPAEFDGNEGALAFVAGLAAYARGMATAESGSKNAAQDTEAAADDVDAALYRLALAPMLGSARDEAMLRGMVEVASQELRAVAEALAGRWDTARTRFEAARRSEAAIPYGEPPVWPRPVVEALGHAALRAGQAAESQAAFEAALRQRPHSGHGLAGLAAAQQARGNAAGARETSRALLEAWSSADPDLPALGAARRLLTEPAP